MLQKRPGRGLRGTWTKNGGSSTRHVAARSHSAHAQFRGADGGPARGGSVQAAVVLAAQRESGAFHQGHAATGGDHPEVPASRPAQGGTGRALRRASSMTGEADAAGGDGGGAASTCWRCSAPRVRPCRTMIGDVAERRGVRRRWMLMLTIMDGQSLLQLSIREAVSRPDQ